MAQEGPKRGPREPQDGPKSAQERPNSAPIRSAACFVITWERTQPLVHMRRLQLRIRNHLGSCLSPPSQRRAPSPLEPDR
eukprot:9259857-Pyramimonas_sp.AAC.2